MIDQQERDKVQLMTIIPQSVAVSLPLDVPKCDITTNEGRPDGHIRRLKATLQSLCDICEMHDDKYTIHDAWLCPRLGPVIDRPICERLGIQADCHCKNFLTSMRTLCILCRPISRMISPLLDDESLDH